MIIIILMVKLIIMMTIIINNYWQERAKGDNHPHCCISWCKSRGERKGKSGKIPGLEERDRKIVETQNGRSRTDSDSSPWKCKP